jgi:AcrR family transcriptional regulator
MVERPRNESPATGRDEEEVEILREYEDGTQLLGVTLVEDKTWTSGINEYHDRYRIVAAGGQSRDIRGGMNMDRRRVAQQLAELFFRFGYLKKRNGDVVPIRVAVDGKPAMAAYLNSVHEMSLAEVAKKMDVSGKTAYQYVDHFKEGRR